MELGVREWMIIIGVLLIVAVVLDGYRRVRNERRGRIRVAVSRQVKRAARVSEPSVDEPVTGNNPELPNGGARPAGHSYGRKVPVLMDPVDVGEIDAAQHTASAAQEQDESESDRWNWADDDEDLSRYDAEPEQVAATAAGEVLESDEEGESEAWHDDDEYDDIDGADDEPELYHDEPEPEPQQVAERATREATDASRRGAPADQRTAAAAQEILVLYVISKDGSGFKGQDLLQLLLACDVRYGKNNIFHRYEEAKGRGAVQFSVANLMEPGTFDLDRMDQLVTQGLCFFMTLPGAAKSITAFNYMVETAQVLVKNLGGELRDEAQSVVTSQTIEHCRQRIRDFERRQLTLHL